MEVAGRNVVTVCAAVVINYSSGLLLVPSRLSTSELLLSAVQVLKLLI